MSCCHVPGEVIVVSTPGSDPQLEVKYTAENWLARNDLVVAEDSGLPMPFVARAPVGEELDFARSLVQSKGVAAALPNHYLNLEQRSPLCQGAAHLNEPALARALRASVCEACAHIGSGEGVHVAVLDTGYHPGSPQVRRLSACDRADKETPSSSVHGTIVCEQILRVAPAIKMTSVRVLGNSRTLSAVLLGLYLIERHDPPDVINLSLSLAVERGKCEACGKRRSGEFTRDQLGKAFAALTASGSRGSGPIFVAAAGNNSDSPKLPASLANVIAVGSYNVETGDRVPYASYTSVPSERFCIAGGGIDTDLGCIATQDSESEPRLFGTSFAAPIVSGIVARYIGYARSRGYTGEMLPYLLRVLRSAPDAPTSHESPLSGLGIARFCCADKSFDEFPNVYVPRTALAPGNELLPAELKHQLDVMAYSLWESDGRQDGRSLEYWMRAKEAIGIPLGLM